MLTTRSIINISMPPAMAKRIKKMAEDDNRTTSELLREAFRVYEFERDWVRIKMWGREIARKMGIETDEDVERIAG